MQFNKSTALVFALSLSALLTGCEAEQTEKDMIAEAQFCLDDARDATSANACMSKISGLTSPQAYSLRCAAGFIAAEVTSPEKLSTALNAIGKGDGTTALLGTLNFGDLTLASNTASSCALSGQTGLSLLGAMAKSATALSNAALDLGSCSGGIQTCDATAIQGAITDLLTDLSGTPTAETIATVEAVGSSIQTVYQSTCGGNAAANEDICNSISSAIQNPPPGVPAIDLSTSSSEDIGHALIAWWKNH